MERTRTGWAGIGSGLAAYGRSFGAIRRFRMRRVYAVSAGLTLLFVLVGAWGIGALVDALSLAYREWWGTSDAWPEEATWWEQAKWLFAQAGDAALQVVAYVALFWLKIKLTKYLVLAFLGPVMAWASERAEAGVTGDERALSVRLMVREFVRGVRSAVLLFFVELGFGAVLFALSLLVTLFAGPVAVVLSPAFAVLSFLMGAWFYGASTFDFIWERRGLGARKGLSASWGMRGRVLGVGLPFQVWMAVPVLSWFVAPIFAPVTCAVAAVLAFPKDELTATARAANPSDLQ